MLDRLQPVYHLEIAIIINCRNVVEVIKAEGIRVFQVFGYRQQRSALHQQVIFTGILQAALQFLFKFLGYIFSGKGYRHPLFTFLQQCRQVWQYPFLGYFLLQHLYSVNQGFGARRTTGYVDINRDYLVIPRHYCV